MSVNAIEPADAQPVAQTQNSELIYRLEDRPPLPQTLFAACQHLLAMFVAVITPALLICQALGLPAQDTQHIISMSLFASGVASIIQIKAWGPVGSGLLSIQGTSFNFVAPLIMGGTALKTGGKRFCAAYPGTGARRRHVGDVRHHCRLRGAYCLA